jgi:branched-chain amino acid transport system substrate-binding protein
MRKFFMSAAGLAVLALAAVGLSPAIAQDTIRIALILCYSGQFADTATQMDNAIKLCVKQNGDTVAGKKIEFIRKDTGGIAPDVAKRLAQEAIVRDHADILAGWVLTPNALAAGDVSKEAKKFMVVMNAATSIIITKSPYMVRTSVTTPQENYPFGKWVVQQGIKNVYVMYSGYGPGIDAQKWFAKGVVDGGGKIVGSVAFPVGNPDFSSFVERAQDLHPQAIYIWVPGGAQPAAIAKALAERGIDPKKTKILGQGELTSDSALATIGDEAIGFLTTQNYDYYLQNPLNKKFVTAYRAEFHRNPDIFSIGGYDGMHLIYAALKKTNGNTDATALVDAAKGMHWMSPRGPISINPTTRDIVQSIYIRRVEKTANGLRNVVVDTIPSVEDPGNPAYHGN